IKSDLRRSLGGENNRCHTQERLQRRFHDHLRIVVSLQYETEFQRINSSAQRPSWLSAICDEMCRTDADKIRAIAATLLGLREFISCEMKHHIRRSVIGQH